MAALLEAQGETIEIGILLDSALSGDDFSEVEPHDEADLLTEQAEAFGVAVESLTQESLKQAILLGAKRDSLRPSAAEISDVDVMLKMMRQAPALMAKWTGCPQLTARIAFVRASDNEGSDFQDRLAGLTSGRVEVFDVPASHNKMCDQDHSSIVALLVNDVLNQAR